MVNGFFRIPIPISPVASRRSRAGGELRDFIGGPENQLARVAAEAFLAAKPAFNPVTFYGPSGSGKSHLTRGLAETFRRRSPDAAVLCAAAVELVQDSIDAVSHRMIDQHKEQLRRHDLLVIEDVDALAGKPLAQQELVRLFDDAATSGAQFFFTSRLPLGEIDDCLASLRSRLMGGLTVPLTPPAAPTRLILLRELASVLQIDLVDDAAQLLAERLEVVVPLLRGALFAAAAASRSGVQNQGGRINLVAAQRYLRSRQRPQIPLRKIAAQTARYFLLKPSDLRGDSRRSGVVLARRVAMFLARRLTAKSFQQIGYYFGNRDHSTVLYNCRRAERLLQSDRSLHDAVSRLERRLAPG